MGKLRSKKRVATFTALYLVMSMLLSTFIFKYEPFKDAKVANAATNVSSSATSTTASEPSWVNGTMMQCFEWYLPNTGNFWEEVAYNAKDLSNAGFTALWLPPAYKADGQDNVGYGAYDLYDLGEFDQKGTVRTKYGTKDQYLNAINELHKYGVQVYADVVLNHKAGADGVETVNAVQVDSNDRNSVKSSAYDIGAWTLFNCSGRGDTYSNFKWNANCFDGVDYDDYTKTNAVFKFNDKSWDWQADDEYGNYDYLMFADVDFDNTYVVDELKRWGEWYINFANLDGFRLDAVKHIKFSFFEEWLTYLRNKTGKELFTVGEYWSWDINKLLNYIKETNGVCSLFDAPLHYKFYDASNGGGDYDMRNLFNDTLTQLNPSKSVSFVENHDTQPGQSLTSSVQAWFKPLAYTAILTRQEGYPCVFYGDYYGTADGSIQSQRGVIDVIMQARTKYAYGTQHDYIDDVNIIGWTREGDSEHVDSGLAALITDNAGGTKTMYVGKQHAGEIWYDMTGNCTLKVTISDDGYGEFRVEGGSHSIYINSKEGKNNTVEIYYKTSNKNQYIHYQVDNGDWTSSPGVKMNKNILSGYGYIKINVSSKLTACFNNGSGTWDSNSGNNYSFSPGVYTVDNGKITSGDPNVGLGKVTIYYKTSWSKAYAHYQVGSGSWTSLPGVQLKKSSVSGYKTITVNLNGNNTMAICFNNGNDSWDNRGGLNYELSAGVYVIADGYITKGTP